MSVQNPDKPITKQDLADFYGEILPYMGGMPPALANKFSRGDLFSTDEKMIGCWIDGRPLYQKTVSTGGSVPSGATLIERIVQTGNDTIRYTKSSDSANSFNISSETDYSTDEHIVGTWINGSYLYQKTISGTSGNRNSNTYYDVGIQGTIDKVIEISGYLTTADNALVTFNPVYLLYLSASYDYSQGKMMLWNDNNNFANRPFYATLRYTKSS